VSTSDDTGTDSAQTPDDRTRVAVVDYTVKAEVYTSYGADFDPEAVNDAVRRELNASLPAGIVVERNGAVYAAADAVTTAEAIDWNGLVSGIDVAQILADHAR